MLNEITTPNLYYNVNECMEYCKKIENCEYMDFTYFHIYWFVGSEFERKQILSIKSYLATQNLKNTKLIFWSNIDLTENKYLKPYLKFIEFRIYDPVNESIDTILENKLDILKVNDRKNWAGGDLFRILILNNYGGVYVDTDVVFLRDFAPLLKDEFMYKWGLEKNMINGAVMRMFKKSKLCSDLLYEISRMGPAPNTVIWSTILYERVRKYNKDWIVYPSAFFNSEWQDYDYVRPECNPQPFKKNTLIKLYDGAFSWHWHNKWDHEIEDGSKWQILEERINNLLKEKNIYFG